MNGGPPGARPLAPGARADDEPTVAAAFENELDDRTVEANSREPGSRTPDSPLSNGPTDEEPPVAAADPTVEINDRPDITIREAETEAEADADADAAYGGDGEPEPVTEPDDADQATPYDRPYVDTAYASPPALVDVRDEPVSYGHPSYEPADYESNEPESYESYEPSPDPSTVQYSTDSIPVLVEGGWEAVRRRRRRQTLTFLGAFAIVLVVGFLASLTYLGHVPWPFGGKVNTAQQVCTRSKPLSPKRISIRVYNGSDRRGLAGQVAAQLKSFGFNVQETGNDPLEAKLRTPIEIRHGDSGDLAALTTTAYLNGKVRDVRDDRQSDTIDVVLGPSFTRVHTRREASRALAALTPSLPLTCPPGASPPASASH